MTRASYKILLTSLLLIFLCPVIALASKVLDNANWELVLLDRTEKVKRSTYIDIADRMYDFYKANRGSSDGARAIQIAARSLSSSFRRFKVRSDVDKSLEYYRVLQNKFALSISRDSYIDSSDIYLQIRDKASAKFILNRLIAKYPTSTQADVARTKLSTISKTSTNKISTPSRSGSPKRDESIAKRELEQQNSARNNSNRNKEESRDRENNQNNRVPENRNNTINKNVDADKELALKAASFIGLSDVQNEIIEIKGVRYFSAKDYTRVVIDTSSTAQYRSIWLSEDKKSNLPPRLTLDISSSSLSTNLSNNIAIKDGLLNSVRVGYSEPNKNTRVVLDSENVRDFTIFQMTNPSRIVVDVFDKKRDEQPKNLPAVAKVIERNNNSNNNNNNNYSNNNSYINNNIHSSDLSTDDIIKGIESNTRISNKSADDFAGKELTLGTALGLKIRTVVIDAGHGGKDGGASYGRLKEKDVVLDIAKKVRDLLSRDKDLKIYMTRSKDIFIPLEERTAIANKYKADLFVSIHANAARNKKASGVETYVFNVTNDRAALEVAALENQATTKSISDLQGILKDILKYSKLEESLLLAGSVQKALVKKVKLSKAQNKGVKQAPFYVLVGATMPSILIETGFLSHAGDAKKLSTSNYRKQIAEGIYQGLRDYIEKYNY